MKSVDLGEISIFKKKSYLNLVFYSLPLAKDELIKEKELLLNFPHLNNEQYLDFYKSTKLLNCL